MRMLKSFAMAAGISLWPIADTQAALSPNDTVQDLVEYDLSHPMTVDKAVPLPAPAPLINAHLQEVLDAKNLSEWAGLPMIAVDVDYYLSAAQTGDAESVATELRNEMAFAFGDTIAKIEQASATNDINPLAPFIALVRGGLDSENVANEYVVENQNFCIMNMPTSVRGALDESVALKVIQYAFACSKTYARVELAEDFAMPLGMYADSFTAATKFMSEDMVDEYIGGFVSQELIAGDNFGSAQLISRYMSLAGYHDPAASPEIALKLMDRIAVFRHALLSTLSDDQTAFIVKESQGQGITAAYAQVLLRSFDGPNFKIDGFNVDRVVSNMILPDDIFAPKVTQGSVKAMQTQPLAAHP